MTWCSRKDSLRFLLTNDPERPLPTPEPLLLRGDGRKNDPFIQCQSASHPSTTAGWRAARGAPYTAGMLREEQIDIRRQRAKASPLRIEKLGKKRVFADYRVTNPASGGQYTVTVHGFDVGDNTCTCPDFKSNTLGTCKHIEAVLESLRDDAPAQVRSRKSTFTRRGS